MFGLHCDWIALSCFSSLTVAEHRKQLSDEQPPRAATTDGLTSAPSGCGERITMHKYFSTIRPMARDAITSQVCNWCRKTAAHPILAPVGRVRQLSRHQRFLTTFTRNCCRNPPTSSLLLRSFRKWYVALADTARHALCRKIWLQLRKRSVLLAFTISVCLQVLPVCFGGDRMERELWKINPDEAKELHEDCELFVSLPRDDSMREATNNSADAH